MSSRRTRSVLAAASALTVFALGACSSAGGTQPAAGDKIAVVTSTDVWGSVVSAVGGDKVDVKSVIHDPSADPHSYETTADDALAATKAKLLVSNGGGYDEFFTKLADTSDAKKLVAYDVAATGDENEHVWYDLPGVEKIADQIAARLADDLQPASEQQFETNARRSRARSRACWPR